MDDRRGRRTGAGSARRHGRSAARPAARRWGQTGQARREGRYGPYVVGFFLVVAALASFLYVGLNWATGPGRVASLASPPTPTPTTPSTVPVAPAPAASRWPCELVYVVRPGDTPAAIAQQFGIETAALLAANNIDDPRRLQIGQTLRIPAPADR